MIAAGAPAPPDMIAASCGSVSIPSAVSHRNRRTRLPTARPNCVQSPVLQGAEATAWARIRLWIGAEPVAKKDDTKRSILTGLSGLTLTCASRSTRIHSTPDVAIRLVSIIGSISGEFHRGQAFFF